MIKLTRIRPVKLPERGTNKAAGLDCFIPEFKKDFIDSLKDKNPNYSSLRPDNFSYYIIESEKLILLAPGERLLIPSGIKMNLDENLSFIFENKSGVASKKGLIVGACVIDEDYTGEIHINMINTSNHIIGIHENEKIIQGILFNVSYAQPVEYSIEQLYETKVTARGSEGFGSTDKK